MTDTNKLTRDRNILSGLQIGWTDISKKRIYFSNEVPGKIQIRIRQEAVWIPTTILLKILNDLLTDTCLAFKEEPKKEKQHE